VVQLNKREKELQQAFLNNEKAVLKNIKGVYQDALDEINSKIELLMARQDADMTHVIYQVQYQQALKKQVEAILETMHSNEFETISDFLTASYEDGFIGALYNIQGQGIPLALPIDPVQVTQAIQMDTKLSETLYKALGKDITALKKNIVGEISRGLATGAMYSEIARNVASQGRIPLNNAMRITRTEAHRIQTKAGMDACVKAKERGADVIKQWDSSLDKRTRDSHRDLDGERRELDKPFSNGLMYAGDPSGKAEEVINCRCAILQRAKWALDADETKHLGDMSGMSDKELEPLAKKLHMDVDELRTHQDEIVPINAKSYSDFKDKYNQLWKYEGSEVQKRAEERIAGYGAQRVRSSAQKINSPINARNTSVGKPSAIMQYDVQLSKRQKELLDSLVGYDSSVIVKKGKVKMTDLSALTAKTGDEFAMFTKGNERLIIRGNGRSVNVTLDKAKELAQNGYRWSGHTHPGVDLNSMQASAGDYAILKAFGQETSVIYNSLGEHLTFSVG
jgi:hypothetical protein